MYSCKDCGRQFQGGLRINNISLWNDYLTANRTISDLSTLYKCSERTIRRRLSLVVDSFTVQIVRRLLTNNPHLPAGVELLALMRRMFSMRKEEFITAFDKWCDKWKEFLNERTLLISGKTTYTHRRLRTARRSIKTHLPWIYTCEEYPDMQIPNTTNLLEGFNSQLKRALHNHNGLNEANKKKFIDGFINTKK
ncbi:IS256 family transposase, variant Zn-binding type [Prevotella melaninogenica]|uniref:IS256 family transposase, variant Zn-binding type n=1 Tax=Prevotella melaninogenica TaxID=28132 RepID=UPI001C5E20C9|nr:hypothetical protein [Prevotella melaninogenica]MBW4730281.1 hypothetical protein [Prevotella melaninogenica]